ncbi:MAG: potassium channel family protein, partial [Gemmataceae bacterium]
AVLRGARLVSGDCRRREILEEAGVAEADCILILTNDDLLNIKTALTVRGLNPEVRIVLRMFNQNLLSRLGKAVHNVFALSTSLQAAPIVAMTALTGQSLGTYRLDDSDGKLYQLVELTIGQGSPLVGQSIANLNQAKDITVVTHQPAGGSERLLLDLSPDTVMQAGDRVILHGLVSEMGSHLSSEDDEEQELRWANAVRRLGRVMLRTLRDMDLAVLICTVILLVVMAVSTLVLWWGVRRYDMPTALLRTVSIMATAAGLHEEEYRDSTSIRVFVSGLRIIGAVLMAAFTAIVTNFLLRARLSGALEVRRIPESGHTIVCGLSTVGFRVVEELVRQKEPVVVIDCDASSRFVPTARRLGAAVIIGDAAVLEVLRQGHAHSARAVVPATNNDMTNLEVALLVRDLQPDVRVVPLLNDPQFAEMLREAAGVELAVSVPTIAAPAFLAGLFGDRVESVFFLRQRLYGVIDLVVGPEDPLAGRPIRDLAIEYQFLPVGLLRQGTPAPRPIVEGRFQVGDRLIGIIALKDLEHLLRRQQVSTA